MRNSILLVDDEPDVLSSIKRALIDENCDIYLANSGADGLKILQQYEIKVVISDEMMPCMTGSEFLSAVKVNYPETVRIILTGQADINSAMRAINKGEIYRFFTKPWNDIELRLTIRSALEKYNLEAENKKLLATVKRQALDIKLIERRYPGISRLDRDESGNLVIPDISEDEFSETVSKWEQEFE